MPAWIDTDNAFAFVFGAVTMPTNVLLDRDGHVVRIWNGVIEFDDEFDTFLDEAPAMLEELRTQHGVHTFVAVLKAANFRSEALLRSLGFEPGSPEQQLHHRDGPDELVMVRQAGLAA